MYITSSTLNETNFIQLEKYAEFNKKDLGVPTFFILRLIRT